MVTHVIAVALTGGLTMAGFVGCGSRVTIGARGDGGSAATGGGGSGGVSEGGGASSQECGDGVVDPGEECDDGNVVDDDGCSAGCTIEGAITVFDGCPGEPLNIFPGRTTSISHSTLAYTDQLQPAADGASCVGIPPGGKDRVFQIFVAESGTLQATVTNPCPNHPACWDKVLYAFGPTPAACGDALSQLACADAGPSSPETIGFPVQAGEEYYVVVDGNAASPGAEGPFELMITLTP